MKIERVMAKLKKAEQEYNNWRKAAEVCEKYKDEPLGEFPESAFRAYIMTGGTVEAAKALNDAGYRIGKRKVISDDISDTIDNVDIENTDLMFAARFLLRK